MRISFRHNRKKYSLEAKRGEDILATLDNFLETNKIDATALKKLRLIKTKEDGLISSQIAEIITKIFNFVLS